MTSFKTKKLPNNHSYRELPGEKNTGNEKNIQPSDQPEKTKKTYNTESVPKSKKIRWKLLGILCMLGGISCIAYMGIQAIGGLRPFEGEQGNIFHAIDITTGDLSKQKEVQNIIIGGIGGLGHPGAQLTDSLIFASLNFKKKSVTMISIPRDMYVAFDKKSAGKINALYPRGVAQGKGINILAEKIKDMTGQPVHHYLIVDFTAFKSLVDVLGGVEVDVPNDIYDREFPTDDDGPRPWQWEVFSLKKGLQTLDGDTALKFARSRHSTNDFDRSYRQQLLVKGMKEKALSLGIVTNPSKIKEIFTSLQENISTDLSLKEIMTMALTFKDMPTDHIFMYSLNNNCIDSACLPGSFLYHPSMAYFGGAWALIPEGATPARLSKYDDITRYSSLIFKYPELSIQTKSISIVTPKTSLAQAKNIRKYLTKLGFPIEYTESLVQTGATVPKTQAIVYWNKEANIGFSEEHPLVQALKEIEPTLPIKFETQNVFVKDQGPRIEIVLGEDAKNYFNFVDPKAYLPKKETPPQKETSDTSPSIDTQKESATATISGKEKEATGKIQDTLPKIETKQPVPPTPSLVITPAPPVPEKNTDTPPEKIETPSLNSPDILDTSEKNDDLSHTKNNTQESNAYEFNEGDWEKF